MKNRMMFVIVAGLLTINAIQAADAQQNQGKNTQRLTPEQFKAREAKLIKALKLSDEQKPKFTALQNEMRMNFFQLQKLGAAERKEKQAAFHKQYQAKLAKLLTKEQMQILAQQNQGKTNRRITPEQYNAWEAKLIKAKQAAFSKERQDKLQKLFSKEQMKVFKEHSAKLGGGSSSDKKAAPPKRTRK